MADTLIDALEWWAHEIPDTRAICMRDGEVTFRQLRDQSARIAACLRAEGVRPGDRVATLATTSTDYCAAVLGIIRARAIACPVNIRFTLREALDALEITQPVLLLFDGGHAEMARMIGERDVRIMRMEEVVSAPSVPHDPLEIRDLNPDDDVTIVNTSGSTAKPKGVVFTHRSLTSYAAGHGLGEPEICVGARGVSFAPMYTGAGMVQLSQYVTTGATMFIESDFKPDQAIELLQREKINIIGGVPFFYEQMAACEGFAAADFSNLRQARVGGAPVSRELLQTWLDKGVLLRQIYGQTEAGGNSTIMSRADAAKYPEKCGRGGLFTEIRIIDDAGGFVGPDVVGEIVVRGPAIMRGYWNDPEATARTLVDGWLHTGDLGKLDHQGYLTFVDRKKDILISGGLNISATEVERVVSEVPGVLEAAVIGAPDDRFGETPMAIVYAPGVSVEEIVAHCNANLANYKAPRYVIVEDQPLPRLATGKLAKPALRSKYLADLIGLMKVR